MREKQYMGISIGVAIESPDQVKLKIARMCLDPKLALEDR